MKKFFVFGKFEEKINGSTKFRMRHKSWDCNKLSSEVQLPIEGMKILIVTQVENQNISGVLPLRRILYRPNKQTVELYHDLKHSKCESLYDNLKCITTRTRDENSSKIKNCLDAEARFGSATSV